LRCIARDGGFRRSGLKRFGGEAKPAHWVERGQIVIAVTDMTQERRIVARAARIPVIDGDRGVFSMDLIRIDPHRIEDNLFLLSLFRYSDFADEVKQHANGANVLHLHPDRVLNFMAVIPPLERRAKFAHWVAPVLDAADVLEVRNEHLRAARDLLLPRLLSGQLDVSRIPDPAEVADGAPL
jgi:type I restriction enzyme S subunit